jgi:hypothetical protein
VQKLTQNTFGFRLLPQRLLQRRLLPQKLLLMPR